jgi:hypothetical protein
MWSWTWWYIPITPALRRLRQKNVKFKASQSYTERTYLKNNNNGKNPKQTKQRV